MRRVVALVSVLAALTGCNAVSPKQPQPSMADDPTGACLKSLQTDPRIQVLAARLGPFGEALKPTLEMMGSKDTPTEVERSALSTWIAARQDCVERGASFRRTHAPLQYQGIIEDYDAHLAIAAAKLYAGDLTFGQFIAERQRLASSAQGRWNQARQTEVRDILNAQKEEAAARARIAADVAQALSAMQPVIAPQPPSAPIIQMPTRCTTQRHGNMSYTNCQ